MSFDASQPYVHHLLRPLGILDLSISPRPDAHTKLLPPTSSSAWKATTHTFFGATSRSSTPAWPPKRFSDDPEGIPFDVRHAIPYDAQSAKPHTPPADEFYLYEERKGAAAAAGAAEEEVPLPVLVAKRYTPTQCKSSSDGLTLLFLPGMGVPKEMFEPMIEVVLQSLASTSVSIAEIWALDMPMSGETALANAPGYLYANEKDITRDILHFITAFLPTVPTSNLSQALPYRRPTSSSGQAVRKRLHVVAHSMGAQACLLAAAHCPNLFASVSVYDPAIIPPGKIMEGFAKAPNELFCTNLRSAYPSRDALREAIKSNKRLAGWDDRAIDMFVARGAMDVNDGVRLTSPPRLEWALYYDKETPTHTFERLAHLRTPINAVLPSRPFATPPKMFQKVIDSLPYANKRLVWIPNTTHQIVYEQIDECARHLCSWLVEQQQQQQQDPIKSKM